MLEQNPLKIFLNRQPEGLFKTTKYSLAAFSFLLFLANSLIYYISTTDCDNYRACFVLLSVFHILDAVGYIHEGYKLNNDGQGLFGSSEEERKAFKLSQFKEKDIIYVYKDKEEGQKELSELGKVARLSYTIVVLLLGLAVFSFV